MSAVNNALFSQHDVIEQFRTFALEGGIELPAVLNTDGALHRFHIKGDKNNSLNGAYTLHMDGRPAGYIKNHKTGFEGNWTYNKPGYTPPRLTPEQSKQQAESIRQNKELEEQERSDKHAEAAKKAAYIWSESTPITDNQHEYLARKGIKGAYSIRLSVYKDITRLVIPVSRDGELSSLQFIKPDSGKTFLKGGKKKGGHFILNEMEDPRYVAIGEGFATIASVIEDKSIAHRIGFMGVMALDAGNLKPVAMAMRERYPAAEILIFGDVGDKDNKGEISAREAAKVCNGFCVLPPIEHGDFNDYLTSGKAEESLDSLITRAHIHDVNADYDDMPDIPTPWDKPENAAAHAKVKEFNMTTALDIPAALAEVKKLDKAPRIFTQISELIRNQVCVSWVIRDYLPLNSTCMIYGESGAGKTFFTLDMCLHIACGLQWQGHKTKQGAVFYVAGEGQTGIAARAMAWALHHGEGLENVPFYCTDGAIVPTNVGVHTNKSGDAEYVKGDIDLFFEDIDAWINSTGEKPMLIIFDTLARCFDGNENSSQDAGEYVKAKDKIKKKYGCCVMSVHHTGKDKAAGGRGSSAFKGAWDAEHCLSVNDGNIELSTTKLKERQQQPPKQFKLESVNTGWFDDDKEPVYSAVMVATDHAPCKKGKHLKGRQQDVLSELYKAVDLYGIETPPKIKLRFPDSKFNAPKRVVSHENWRKLAFSVIPIDNKSQAFTVCRNQLEELGRIGYYDGYYWPVN